MERLAFFQGKFIPFSQAKIGISTHAFLYGTACFEGIRAYWNEDTGEMSIFRMKEHYQRLINSCKILRIKPKYDIDQLCDLTIELVKNNPDEEDIYIRPIYYKSESFVGVKLDGLKDDFLLFSTPFGAYLDLDKGLKAKVSSWRHLEDNMIPMRAKINGAYVNAALAKSEVLADGYDEAIFLDSSGHVSEGSAENLFLIRNNKLITSPITSDILEGITRSTIIELAKNELGIETEERQIDRTELYIVDEAFFAGTGAQVSPIIEIDHRKIGTGQIGEISKNIQNLYFKVVKNQVSNYAHWCTTIKRSH